MANHHQPTSPIQERQDTDYHDPFPSWCSPCFGSKWWRLPSSDHQQDHSWWGHVKGKLVTVREISEVVAGPKWKNFVRKVGSYFRGKKPRANFQYDAESYALNFDEGNGEEEDGLLLPNSYSSRFVASSLPSRGGDL